MNDVVKANVVLQLYVNIEMLILLIAFHLTGDMSSYGNVHWNVVNKKDKEIQDVYLFVRDMLKEINVKNFNIDIQEQVDEVVYKPQIYWIYYEIYCEF